MTDKEYKVKPFNLYLAGNVVHGLTSFLDKIAETCAVKLQVILCHTLNAELSVMPFVEIEQITLDANHDKSSLRSWTIINNNPHNMAIVVLDRGIYLMS